MFMKTLHRENLVDELMEERWPSGLRRTPGKRVGGNASGVRIPVFPFLLILRTQVDS